MKDKILNLIIVILFGIIVGILAYILLVKEEEKEISITLDKSNVSLYEGETTELIATITPNDYNKENILYESENNEIATVTSEGLIIGKTVGNTKIIVRTKDNKVRKEVNVMVSLAPTPVPTPIITPKPTPIVTPEPTIEPTVTPTLISTPKPTVKPTATPTPVPTPIPTPDPVIQQTPIKVQSGFTKTKEYNSSTFKYWIEHANFNGGSAGYKEYGSTNLFFTHIWVKDPASQIKIALGGGTSLGNNQPKTIMKNEISRYGYESKGLVAVNSSFFGDSKISDWGSTQSTRVVIYNNQILRDDCSKDFGSGKAIYLSYGITRTGEIKTYNTASTSTCASARDAMINDGVKYSGSAFSTIKKGFVDNATRGYSRTMICTVDKNNFILLSVYNWKFDKAANVAYDKLGCQGLISVDGGGSTTLLFKNNTNNLENSFLTDRKLADMLYFVEQ